MSRLGAILAGGQATRFGSDKAAAVIDGIALLDRVARALRPQCDALVVVGRDWPGLVSIPDRPRAGLGPLGGLAGALEHARAGGLDTVLTAGCDLPDIPPDLAALLAPAPAVAEGQPLLGLWPAALAPHLSNRLAAGTDRSLHGWVAASGARAVPLGAFANINTAGDLARYTAKR